MVNSSFWHNFYANSIKALFYLVPFLPLYVANSMLFPYITGRNFAFRIIVEIALVFWIGLAALDKRYRPELSWLMQAVLVFTAVVFVADIFGVSFYRSFWSNYERMEGFLMIAHMAAFFVIAGTVFRLKEWSIFAHLVLIGSFGVAFWALLQRLGYSQSIQGGNRVEGSIGNPSYLAAYLMLTSVVALVLFLSVKLKWMRWFYGILIGFQILMIYFSATRGTTLALIGGIILFAGIYFWLSREDKQNAVYRPMVTWAVMTAIIVPLFFWSIRNTEFVKSSPSLQRLTSTSFSSQTIQSRILIWQLALEGIKEKPILGWGQENFNLVFNKYFKPRLWQQEPWFDRAHNIVLDWLANAGILGLVSYLSLFAAAFYALWKLYKSRAVNAVIFGVAISGFAAHFAQNLTVFDNFNTYFIFFGALAFLQSYTFQNAAEISLGKTASHYRHDNSSNSLSMSISLFAVFIFVGASALYFLNIKPMQESKLLIRTLGMVRSDAPPKVVMPSFMETFSLNTFGDREVTEQLAQYGIRVADTASIANDDKKAVLMESIKHLENQVKLMPEDIRYRLFLASLGYLRMAFFDQQYIPKAEQEFRKIIAMTPTKQNLYIGIIQLYLGINEYEQAFKLAEQMYKLDTEYPDGRLFYATTAIYSGRFDIAEDFLAQNAEFRSAPRGVFIANAYAAMRRFKPMVSLYQDIIKSDSKNPQYYASLAAVYAELGKKDLAKQQAEEAIRVDPGFKEQGTAFIKMLGF